MNSLIRLVFNTPPSGAQPHTTKPNHIMDKYYRLLANLKGALRHSLLNLGNGHSPNRVNRLKALIFKVEKKLLADWIPLHITEELKPTGDFASFLEQNQRSQDSQDFHQNSDPYDGADFADR